MKKRDCYLWKKCKLKISHDTRSFIGFMRITSIIVLIIFVLYELRVPKKKNTTIMTTKKENTSRIIIEADVVICVFGGLIFYLQTTHDFNIR